MNSNAAVYLDTRINHQRANKNQSEANHTADSRQRALVS